MRKYMLTATLVVVALPLCALTATAASAREMSGYIVRTTVMRAGPDYDYPAVQRLRRDSSVTVHGCLRDWDWCDVSNRYDRGWVARRDIEVSYQGRRRYIGSSMGIFILSFSFGNYWDSYYRSRPFYSQRPRWEQHYTNNYRPSWGPRSNAPVVTPPQSQPGWGGGRGGRPQGQAVPNGQYVPAAPQLAPQGTPQQPQPGRGARPQSQAAPATPQLAPQQAMPETHGNPNPQAAPDSGNQGQRRGQGGGQGERGNSEGKSNNGRKSRD